ncbi:MAG: alpha-amylase family glycosyl hydrolase, partial [Bacteroidota bacterium]
MRNFPLFLLTLLFLSALSTRGLAQEIERVEPPNWWVGFENTELQLLVYGQDIGHLKPVVEYPGVSVKQVIRTENDHYLFLYLNVSPNTRPGKFPIIFTSKGLEVLRRDYELLPRKAGAAEVAGFDNTDVMYLITPDRFANGDPDNDAVAEMKEGLNREYKGGRHGGDIKGIWDNLDYISDMGFTAIWVNPVLENNMEQYSYHGYYTTDFYRVDPRFGSNESYRDLGAAAGAKGVKLIMDMILNHCGSNHWFVLDPPTKDWINYGGEYVNTSHRRTTVQDVHASAYDQKRFSDGWFVQTMPDLNQRNPLFGTYLIQNSIWWVEYAGLAGIRMDTYPYSDAEYLSQWSCALMREYPNFSIVGEEWSPQPAIVSYWQAGKENHDGYASCLPNLMDFPLQEAMRSSLAGEHESWNDPWIKLYETLALDFLYPAYDDLVVFPDNHDMARIFTQVGHDYALWQLALTYVLTTRGIPQVYYGTEI